MQKPGENRDNSMPSLDVNPPVSSSVSEPDPPTSDFDMTTLYEEDEAKAPTLDTAFMVLCQALEARLESEDQIPDMLRCQEIQGWYANGNHVVAWAQAVLLLEQALGTRLGH